MDTDLLSGLGDEQRRLLVSRMTRRAFRKGDTLFFEGDPGDSLHVLLKGKVAVRTSTSSGDVVTLAVLGVGAPFGEQALIAPDSRRTASVVALEASETRMLHRVDFEQLRESHPSVERFLVELLAAQVRRLSDQVLEALYVPAETRVIRRLADLADLYAVDSGSSAVGGPLEVPIRQEDLASMAGTTRPTANRVLKHLEEAGLITLARGRTFVLDRAALRARAR